MIRLFRSEENIGRMTVKCPKCSEEFKSCEVETLDVREDFEGRDVVKFVCPDCGEEVESLVFVRN